MAALRTALKRLLITNMTVSCDRAAAAAAVSPTRGLLLPSICAALESHGFSSLVRCGV